MEKSFSTSGKAGEPPVKIPAGIYEGQIVSLVDVNRFSKKVAVNFYIDKGEYAGSKVPYFLRTKKDYRASSHYYQFYAIATGKKPDFGEDLNLDRFVGQRFEFEVRTVTKDHLRRNKPEVLWYSVIGSVIRRISKRSEKEEGEKEGKDNGRQPNTSACNQAPETSDLNPETSNLFPLTHNPPPTTHLLHFQSGQLSAETSDWKDNKDVPF